jgi:hypothetical protein
VIGLAQDGAEIEMQRVLHRIAGETHLTRVDGNSVFVLRRAAQGAGYVGFELSHFRAAAAEDLHHQRQDARHHK